MNKEITKLTLFGRKVHRDKIYITKLQYYIVYYITQSVSDNNHRTLPLWFGGLEFSQRLPLCVS